MAAPANLQEGTTVPRQEETDRRQHDEQGNESTSSVTYTGDSDDDTGYPAPRLEDSDEHYMPREDNDS